MLTKVEDDFGHHKVLHGSSWRQFVEDGVGSSRRGEVERRRTPGRIMSAYSPQCFCPYSPLSKAFYDG